MLTMQLLIWVLILTNDDRYVGKSGQFPSFSST